MLTLRIYANPSTQQKHIYNILRMIEQVREASAKRLHQENHFAIAKPQSTHLAMFLSRQLYIKLNPFFIIIIYTCAVCAEFRITATTTIRSKQTTDSLSRAASPLRPVYNASAQAVPARVTERGATAHQRQRQRQRQQQPGPGPGPG